MKTVQIDVFHRFFFSASNGLGSRRSLPVMPQHRIIPLIFSGDFGDLGDVSIYAGFAVPDASPEFKKMGTEISAPVHPQSSCFTSRQPPCRDLSETRPSMAVSQDQALASRFCGWPSTALTLHDTCDGSDGERPHTGDRIAPSA